MIDNIDNINQYKKEYKKAVKAIYLQTYHTAIEASPFEIVSGEKSIKYPWSYALPHAQSFDYIENKQAIERKLSHIKTTFPITQPVRLKYVFLIIHYFIQLL